MIDHQETDRFRNTDQYGKGLRLQPVLFLKSQLLSAQFSFFSIFIALLLSINVTDMEQIDKDDYLVSTIPGDDETLGSNSYSNSAGSSSDLSQFGVFTNNGIVRVDEESEEHKIIKIFFILGMAREANFEVVHKNVCSEGSTSQARLERFRSFSKAVARKYGGNANIVPAWYWWFQG